MRRASMATRDELIEALAGRYGEAGRIERGRILDEFVAVTGYHRKHAMRVLREGATGRRHGPRPSQRIYGEAVREALTLLWEASDRVCSKRLKPLLPILLQAMDRWISWSIFAGHGRLSHRDKRRGLHQFGPLRVAIRSQRQQLGIVVTG